MKCPNCGLAMVDVSLSVMCPGEKWSCSACGLDGPAEVLESLAKRLAPIPPAGRAPTTAEYELGERIEDAIQNTPASQRPTIAGMVATEVAKYRATIIGTLNTPAFALAEAERLLRVRADGAVAVDFFLEEGGVCLTRVCRAPAECESVDAPSLAEAYAKLVGGRDA